MGKAGRRGKHRNPAQQRRQAVSFVDPVPPGDRYNLAFHAKYGPREVILREVDKRFFEFYHSNLPGMIQSSTPWASSGLVKTPSSRTTCKCEEINEVESICDIVAGLYRFVTDPNRPAKKFGTIFISAHGGPQGVALPIARGAPRVSVEELGRGLRKISSISRQAPTGFTQQRWDQLRGPLLRLETQLSMLGRRIDARFDEHSMIRFWVCYLGQSPAAGAPDSLQMFGRILVPSSAMILEAPRVVSTAGAIHYTGSPPGTAIWNHLRRSRYLHPDVVNDVESDVGGHRFTGSDLNDAHEEFGTRMLTPGQPPGRRVRNVAGWVPVFGLSRRQGGRTQNIRQGQWSRYHPLWRRVTLAAGAP